MATETYVEDVTMDNASNGVIISYRKCIKKPASGKNTYDSTDYKYEKEVFDVDDEDESEDSELEKAFARYKELFMQARAYKLKKA